MLAPSSDSSHPIPTHRNFTSHWYIQRQELRQLFHQTLVAHGLADVTRVAAHRVVSNVLNRGYLHSGFITLVDTAAGHIVTDGCQLMW
jgi:hypothetical protein